PALTLLLDLRPRWGGPLVPGVRRAIPWGREPEDRLQRQTVRQRRHDAARRPQGLRGGTRDPQEIRRRGDPVGAAARHGSDRDAYQGHLPRDRRQREEVRQRRRDATGRPANLRAGDREAASERWGGTAARRPGRSSG